MWFLPTAYHSYSTHILEQSCSTAIAVAAQDGFDEPSSARQLPACSGRRQRCHTHVLQGHRRLVRSAGTLTGLVAECSAAALGAAQAVAVALHAFARAVLAEALGPLMPVLLHELGPQRVVQLHSVLRIQGTRFARLR